MGYTFLRTHFCFSFRCFCMVAKQEKNKKRAKRLLNNPWLLVGIYRNNCYDIWSIRRYTFYYYYPGNYMVHWYQYGYTGASYLVTFSCVTYCRVNNCVWS